MNWESRCWPTVNGMTGSFEHCSDGSHNGSSIKPPVDWQFHGDYTIPKKCFFWYTHEKYGIFFWYMMFGWWLILCYVLYIYTYSGCWGYTRIYDQLRQPWSNSKMERPWDTPNLMTSSTFRGFLHPRGFDKIGVFLRQTRFWHNFCCPRKKLVCHS